MTKQKLVRIVLIVCIVIAVAGIWFIKNNPLAPEGEGTNNKDFALEADSIDLDALAAYKMPVIIDFGADYCVPCREFEPILQATHKEMLGKAIIKFVDTEKHADIASQFPVQVIPTQVFINSDGTPYVPTYDLGVEFIFYDYKDSNEHAYTVHEGGLTKEELRLVLADMGVADERNS